MNIETNITTNEALCVDAAGFQKMIGVSQSAFFALKRNGMIGPRPIRFGRSVRYRTEEIRNWLAAGAPSAARWQAQGSRTGQSKAA